MRRLAGATVGFLALVAIAVVFGRPPRSPRTGQPLRLGYFCNVTHTPAIVLISSGEVQSRAPHVQLVPIAFNAGPAVMEALTAGELDFAYVGPAPAITAYLRSRSVVVLAGCTSGGASLVARGGSKVESVATLDGKTVAVPQLGNTQDVSLRAALARVGLAPKEKGGSVTILPIQNAELASAFSLGHIDAAWVPEPFASRLVISEGGRRVIDERDLWPARAFATTLLVGRRAYVEAHPAESEAVLVAHEKAVLAAQTDPSESQQALQARTKQETGARLPEDVLAMAWRHLDFTTDPLVPTLRMFTEEARSLGYLNQSSTWDDKIMWRRP